MAKFKSLKRYRISLVVFCISCVSTYAQQVNIIPYPQQVSMQSGSFNLSHATKIYYDAACNNEAIFLQQALKDEQQLKVFAAKKKDAVIKTGNIYLNIYAADSVTLGKEGYTLKVDENNIVVNAATTVGVFYGVQSIRQLIQNKTIPAVTITDKPAFQWRGFMLDEGRYFKGEKVVKDFLDEMALLKMNTFHWHLTDDGGWRIEIKKYPKLTEIGSKRRMSELGTWLSNVFDSVPHSGFYTQEQIKDIIKYAADRHITIIPEIEMPGHARAAIASYPWLGAENKQIEVPISFGIKPDVFNVADAKVKQFLHDVLDEVMALFPSKIVHIGGDEVLYDQWKASKQVNEFMKQNNIKSPADLQIDFTNGIAKYLEQHDHRMLGWNEILGGHHQNNDSTDAVTQQQLSKSAIIDFWTGDPKIVADAAMKGYDVVNSYWYFTYLDYDYKTTTLERAYSFNPVPDSLPIPYRKKILGLNTQMWGEWIPTVERMNFLAYPRIAALAEVGWTDASQKNYRRFLDALLKGNLKNRWEKRGITLSDEQVYGPK